MQVAPASPNLSFGSGSSGSRSSFGSVLGKIGNSILGGLPSIASDVLGYFSNRSTNKAQLRLAELQNKWNIEQWNRENEYNKPVNQIKRLEEAGINPMLMTGQLSPGVASNIQSADLANQTAYSDFSGVRNLSPLLLQKESNDISRYEADTHRIDVESNLPIKKQQLLNMKQEEINLKKTQDQIVANTQHIHQLLSNARKEGIKLNKEIDYQDLMNNFEREFGSKTRQAQLDNLLADVRHKDKLIKQIDFNMQMALKEFQQHVREWKWTRFNENRLFKLQYATTNANIKLINSEIDKNKNLTPQQKKQLKLNNENYWNQRGQDFLQQTFNMLMFILMVKGKGNIFGKLGKGSYKPPTMDGKPPVPYN